MSRPRLTIRSAAWTVSGVVVASLLLIGFSGLAGPDRGPGSTAVPSREPGSHFTVHLGRVLGHGVGGRVHPSDLAASARAVARTMTDLYSAAFVDPAAWHNGTFPGIFRLFAGAARVTARGDLRELTLGRAAAKLDAVRPRMARVNLRFLTDASDRPSVAFADMSFEGTGVAGTAEIPLRQGGTFTLRRVDGVWRIVAYDVRSSTSSGGFRRPRPCRAFPHATRSSSS
jgi:hypothetical protein